MTENDSLDKTNHQPEEKFKTYAEKVKTCYEKRDSEISIHFKHLIKLWNDEISHKPDITEKLKLDLADSVFKFFNFVRNKYDVKSFREFFPMYKSVESSLDNKKIKAYTLQSIGYMFWLQQDFTEAKKYLEESLELINSTQEYLKIPNRYTNIGFVYEQSGDLKKAQELYYQGLEYGKKHNSLEAVIMAYSALGRICTRNGNYQNAKKYLKEAVELYGPDSTHPDLAAVINNLASIYISEENYEAALEYFEKIVKDWLKEQNAEGYYGSMTNLALCLIHLDQPDLAEKKLLESLDFSLKNDLIENSFACYIRLKTLYFKKNDLKKAFQVIKKAEEISKKSNLHFDKLEICYSWYHYFQTKNYTKRALSYLHKAENILIKSDDSKDLVKVLELISECYEKLEDKENAYKYIKESIMLRRKLKKSLEVKDIELSEQRTVSSGRGKQYIFKESLSLISEELTQVIGTPIIGRSQKMQQVIENAYQCASCHDSNILITGESGTGKELIARLIHFSSFRHKKPFKAVNSAVFSPGLVYSSLFGHVKGAFTGAISNSKGVFETAQGGTVFLDEITEMPINIQPQLLRVLEDKVITPLGSDKEIKIDFRLISATNKDLHLATKENKFRFDLLNRINTLEISIPPLRERKEDISLLIEYYLSTIPIKMKRKRPEIDLKAINILCDYSYPGNIRELHNIMEKLILFNRDDFISAEDVLVIKPPEDNCLKNDIQSLDLSENEIMLIKEAIRRSGNVKTEAAKLLGITPFALYRRIKKYDLDL